MKKLLIMLCVIMLVGCSASNNNDNNVNNNDVGKENINNVDDDENIKVALTPCVMINDKLYYIAGDRPEKRDDLDVDGVLDSNVPGTEYPTKNNQSNLASTGQEYSIISDEVVYVHNSKGMWTKYVLLK